MKGRLSMRDRAGYIGLLVIGVAVGLCVGGCSGGVDDLGVLGDGFVLQPPADGEVGVVTGQVITLREGAPVPRVAVTVGGVVAVTDASGAFVAQRVPVGRQWLTVDGLGYSVLGGPVRVEVVVGVRDLGRVVVDATAAVPPAVPD